MQESIKQRVEAAPAGTIFITSDFADVATVPAINVALSRMTNDDKLRRVMRGVYEKPRFNELLGELVAPNIEQVAHAIARNFNWSIAPAGDTALNLLGLSSQVPAVWQFVSDGPYKEYVCRGVKIKFSHSANKEISGKSPITAIAIQAIKALGKNISKADIEMMRSVISDCDKGIILREAQGTTAWVYDVIKEIVGDV